MNIPLRSTRLYNSQLVWLVLGILLLVSLPVPCRSQEVREADLVELVVLDSSIKIDVRYASTNNFMKRKMYSQARAFLQRPAAEALVRANARVKKSGYGLLVFDGYRPWSVTKKFWDETPREKRKYVANPKYGSKHNRGCAVDLSLYVRATGNEVEMQTEYDNFTIKAAADYAGASVAQRRLRKILRDAMESEGFTVNPDEWWHFDHKDWRNYKVLDIPFEQLK